MSRPHSFRLPPRAGGRAGGRWAGGRAAGGRHLGAIFAHLRSILAHLGAILAHLGYVLAHLGSSWHILAPSWLTLAPPWPILAPSWPILAPPWPKLFLHLILSGTEYGYKHRTFTSLQTRKRCIEFCLLATVLQKHPELARGKKLSARY